MREQKIRKIDFGSERLGTIADKYYNEGNHLKALKLAYKQYDLYGGSGDVFVRLCDIYEAMGLHASAINWWFRFLNSASEEDLPDIYEGLAVNYLNMGNETIAAYYYNRLIDSDEGLPEETKLDIIDAFSKDKRSGFRFVYPPEISDYSKEVNLGSKMLKVGDCARALDTLSVVEKGSKDYAAAMEIRAVAQLLLGKEKEAELVCNELLTEKPDDIRVLATLAAVYLEQGRNEESHALAVKLAAMEQTNTDDLYKVATVCCENGMHAEAYQKFIELEKKIPFDGRMLYFKGVAAYKSGLFDKAEEAFDTLCSVYPDAEVAKYYLKAMRECREREEEGQAEGLREEYGLSELSYFYHVPQSEREIRCRSLIHIGKAPKDEARLFGLIALHDGFFRWCFDEMDGTDHDLQYLAIITAAHVGADDFLGEVFLDSEVLDMLKIEALRLMYLRNVEEEIGLVLCHIYRKIRLLPVKIGRKRRRRFLGAYAKVASKFAVVRPDYGGRLKVAADVLYKKLAEREMLDLIQSEDDCACAIFLLSGIKDLGGNTAAVAGAFEANMENVQRLIDVVQGIKKEENERGEM